MDTNEMPSLKRLKVSHDSCSEGSLTADTTNPDKQNQQTSEEVREGSAGLELKDVFPYLPAHVLDEVFDFLDVQQNRRLSRVSKSWAHELSGSPHRNKCTIVLKDDLLADLIARRANFGIGWSAVFCTLAETIKHIIFIVGGSLWDLFNSKIQAAAFPTVFPLLQTITYCGGCFRTRHIRLLWETPIESVVFRDCKVQLFTHEVALPHTNMYWELMFHVARKRNYKPGTDSNVTNASPEEIKGGKISWIMQVDSPRFELKPATLNPDEKVNQQEILMMATDEGRLVWPHSEEQELWIKKSIALLVLVGNVHARRAAKDMEKAWLQSFVRNKHYRSILMKMRSAKQLEEGGSQKMTLLRLAFLGRLFSVMNNHVVIPGMEPPPVAFPHDFKFI